MFGRFPGAMKKRYLKLVRRALRTLRHPRLRHRRWWQALTRPVRNRALWIPCRHTVASGLAIGLFFSVIPIPFQMIPATVLAIRAKSNVPFAIAATWVSNPVTTPFILWAQMRLGDWMIHTLHVPMPLFLKVSKTVPGLGELNMDGFLLGTIVSAVLLALAAYPLVHLFSMMMPHHLPLRSKNMRPAAARAAKPAPIP